MDQMTAFERQISTEMQGMVGPVPDVEPMQAARSAAIHSPRWRFPTMFSATKYIVAGVIVALFGGFLLSGVLTSPSEESAPAAASASPATPSLAPTSTVDPLAQALTEEVEPGVLRVVNDGTRDLSRMPQGLRTRQDNTLDSAIAAGPDGSIWMSMPEGSFRVGEAATSDGDAAAFQTIVKVGPDGRVWKAWTTLLRSRADGSWTIAKGFQNKHVIGIEITSDGAVWARTLCRGGSKCKNEWGLTRLDGDDRTTIAVPDRFAKVFGGAKMDQRFSVSPEGEVWMNSFVEGSRFVGTLVHYDGERWESVDPTGSVDPNGSEAVLRTGPFDLGTDGTLWVYLRDHDAPSADLRAHGWLARLIDGQWTTFSRANGVPSMVDMYMGFQGFLRAAPDGSVWLTPQPDNDREGECDGVANFDGTTWKHYLRGHCVYAFDVAADGSAWLHAQPEPDHSSNVADRIDTFVIPSDPTG